MSSVSSRLFPLKRELMFRYLKGPTTPSTKDSNSRPDPWPLLKGATRLDVLLQSTVTSFTTLVRIWERNVRFRNSIGNRKSPVPTFGWSLSPFLFLQIGTLSRTSQRTLKSPSTERSLQKNHTDEVGTTQSQNDRWKWSLKREVRVKKVVTRTNNESRMTGPPSSPGAPTPRVCLRIHGSRVPIPKEEIDGKEIASREIYKRRILLPSLPQ